MEAQTATDELAGWVPLFLTASSGQTRVEWGYMGAKRFTEPFCFDTLQMLARRPFNQLFRRQSGLELLLERVQRQPGLPLKGLVFHMSRCGSTLAAQWLAALPDSVVLSEPEPVDTLLQWPVTEDDVARIQALLAALGQPRRAGDRHLFLKTDCWHMAHIDRLLAAFPGTPWVFLYRDPVEVLVSHRWQPGWQMVPGALTAHGFHPPADLQNKPLANGAWLLGRILEQARHAIQRHGNGLLVNYAALPGALEDKIAGHFGLELDELDPAPLRAASQSDAKRGQAPFRADASEKRAAADEEVLELAARWLDAPYQWLEQHAASLP
ncbi:MAG: hypothetical protein HY850_03115 [Betaproteobacteria bacterium]|nr:hypothetical protein [Betaproteobacteria bacterium]